MEQVAHPVNHLREKKAAGGQMAPADFENSSEGEGLEGFLILLTKRFMRIFCGVFLAGRRSIAMAM